ncbi:helix-turn-helix domain-containing protein [Nonomuraea sp. NPDC050404]|uniref:helix-turn-helix domain-containing protein n=1 Tax=Nonomuraea sp. NPDC050404 TaxID=3155783 RepID=UPI0033D9755D
MSARIATDFEQARVPEAVGLSHPYLRSLLTGKYTGYSGGAAHGDHLLRPATAAISLVLKVRDSPRRPPAFVHGSHSGYSTIEGACAPSYLEVRLAPLGAYAALGVPLDKLNAGIVDLNDIIGPEIEALAERVRSAPTWDRRFRLVDGYLLRRIEDGPRPSPEVAEAWRRLIATGGADSIRAIAEETGWSHKHLIAKFKQQVGLAPKTVARLIRFNRLLARLREDPLPRWDEIAADCGYADQAHLTRDFRDFTGTTPGGFVDVRHPHHEATRLEEEFVPADDGRSV